MRHLKKMFLIPTMAGFVSGCPAPANVGLDGMPIYPDAPPPPFTYEIQPIKLFSNPEADFTCRIKKKDPKDSSDAADPSDIRCWGDNSFAQVNGTGEVSASAAITTVSGIPKFLTDPITGEPIYVNTTTKYVGKDSSKGSLVLFELTHLSVGKAHACVSLDNDSIWCWGDNSKGQIKGSTIDPLPLSTIRVGEDILPDAVVNALASGNEHTCAAFADDENSVWCWGNNSDAQITGDGIPETVVREEGTYSTSPSFTNVTANSDLPKGSKDYVIALAAGHNFTCALYDHRANLPLTAQTVWCWGDNSAGQVTGEKNTIEFGIMPTSVPTKATRVLGLPTNKIVNLSVGYNHACVNMADGNIWCWGSDQNAEVSGIKNTTTVSPGITLVQGIPNGVVPKKISVESNILSLTAGGNFTCANFKALGDELWCWGDNQNGVVDGAGMPGAFAQRITQVSSIHESIGLSAGAHHICASFTDGNAKCWGSDSKGQVTGTGILGKSFESIKPLKLN